jgi:hypothetical protein
MASTDSALHKDLFELENATALLQRREQQFQNAINDQQAKEDVILAATKEKLAALDEAAARQLECFTHDVYFMSDQLSAAASSRHSPAPHSLSGCELAGPPDAPVDDYVSLRNDPRLQPVPVSCDVSRSHAAKSAGSRLRSPNPSPYSAPPRIQWNPQGHKSFY